MLAPQRPAVPLTSRIEVLGRGFNGGSSRHHVRFSFDMPATICIAKRFSTTSCLLSEKSTECDVSDVVTGSELASGDLVSAPGAAGPPAFSPFASDELSKSRSLAISDGPTGLPDCDAIGEPQKSDMQEDIKKAPQFSSTSLRSEGLFDGTTMKILEREVSWFTPAPAMDFAAAECALRLHSPKR